MNSTLGWTALALALLFAPRVARAEAPAMMPVQGFLTDSAGAPINGSVNVVFRLYDSSGATLYSDVLSVFIDQGVFSAYLGSGAVPLDLSIFETDEVSLGIQVGNDPEMTPRIALATAPYAAYALVCGDSNLFGGLAPAAFAPAAHTHAWTDLTGVPAGFADGTDDSTTYTAGAGLTLNGTQFAVSSVTSAQISDGTIATIDLANSSVDSSKIADDAVTSAKLAAGAVTARELDLLMGSDENATTIDMVVSPTDLLGTANVTPTASGMCFVIASVVLADNVASPNPTGADVAYVQAELRDVNVPANAIIGAARDYINTFAPGGRVSASAMSTFAVVQGTTYNFGCHVTFTGEWGSERIERCATTWFCQ